MNLRQFLLVFLGAAAVAIVIQCGGSSSPPTQPTPPPTTTTTTTLPSNGLPAGMVCNPTPPPVLYVKVKMHAYGGNRNVLDSAPQVANVDDYCSRAGMGNNVFCFTRPEGDLQRVACDYLATGKAKDTGRWGPTWYYEGRPCSQEPQTVGCSNDPDNQFMAIAKGDGEYAACVYPPGGDRICGVCNVVVAKGKGCW
jgi:hypothetical protein